jgi:hypothetical protein
MTYCRLNLTSKDLEKEKKNLAKVLKEVFQLYSIFTQFLYFL